MENIFSEVLGQTKAKEVLARNLARKKIASTYLFAGPEGTGKMGIAKIFARAILCREATPGLKDCGCKSCAMFNGGTHPDFMGVIPTESKSKNENFHEIIRNPEEMGLALKGRAIKIEQVRELISAVSLKSYFGGWKAVIVESPESMKKEPANAFLKTLEEPPKNTVIILVSSSPSALLPTILSRCRVVRFVPMRPTELAKLLEVERSFSSEEALTAATLSEGRPGAALGDMAHEKGIDGEANDLLSHLLEMRPSDVVSVAERWRERRDDIPLLFHRIGEILRFATRGTMAQSSDRMSSALRVLGTIPPERLVDAYYSVIDRGPSLVYNPNVQLLMESTLLNLQSIILKGEPIAG
ncbi:MAG: DNA polymerase III subunit [Nitrospinota bacterium]|nr:DNA polymerase III subunit [Nitrospinota bacterium]